MRSGWAAVSEAQRTVAIAVSGTALALISYTAPLATFNTISSALETSASGQSWILSSSSLGLTAALLTTGTLADEFGRRRVFGFGSILLAASSVLGALAPNTILFVAGRLLQGIGAAAVLACSLALISQAIEPGPRRAHAMGLWGAGLAGGIGFGPIVSGLLDWRLFYLLIGLCALGIGMIGRWQLAESTSGDPRPVDLPGMVLLAGGLTLFLAGLTGARQLPIGAFEVLLLLAGLALLLCFVMVEQRSKHPMVPLDLFTNPGLVAACLGSLALGLGVISLLSYLPAVLQRTHGYSAAQTALVLLAWSGTSIVTALLAKRIRNSIDGATRLALSLGVIGLSMLALAKLGVATPAWLVITTLFVAGLATGVVNATLGAEAVASVPPSRAAMGSGINNTTRYLGAALGVTYVSVLSSPTGNESTNALLSGWHVAVLMAVALTAICAIGIAFCARSQRMS